MRKLLVSLAAGVAGLLGSAAANAHGPAWSVTIGTGGIGAVSIGVPGAYVQPQVIHGYPAPYSPARVYAPPAYYAAPVVYAPPVHVIPVYPRAHHHGPRGYHAPHRYWRGY